MREPAPIPDKYTGEPRPPEAPVRRPSRGDDRRDLAKARYHTAPESEGPALEWYQEQKRSQTYSGIAISLLIFGFLYFKDSGFSWMGTWWLWLFVLWPAPVFFLLYSWNKGISAGAQWYAGGNRYVNTYDLTKIKVEGASAGMAWSLYLTDSAGRHTGVGLGEIQANRRLWDLVYNGILHSVQQRPDAPNKRAVDILQLQ